MPKVINYAIMIGLLLGAVLNMSSCRSSNSFWQSLPRAMTYTPPPVIVDMISVYDEYTSSDLMASEKYEGSRLFFNQVEVETVGGNWFFMAVARGAADLVYVKLYFTSGPLKFYMHEDYFNVMQNIEEGYVLNIAGNPAGLNDGFLLIKDCWVESVFGDIGLDKEISYGY